MAKSLFVPIRIEGLFVQEDSLVCAPLANYERLPWSDGQQDYNYDVPFLGDSIVNKPFSDRNCRLKKGLHLHFILPHFLGQPIPNASNLDRPGELPAAPNYWVIVKKKAGAVEQTFYVQSDYIHSKIDIVNPDYYCVVPIGIPSEHSDAETNKYTNERPYAYMGLQSTSPPDYSENTNFRVRTGAPLTVTGFGDINFSSFYPNCKGVFGFCDREFNAESMSNGSNYEYEVYGWVHEANDDVLQQYLLKNADPDTPIQARLANLFNVEICDNTNDKPILERPVIDGRTIYYAKFVCDGNQNFFKNEAPNLPLKIAFGHTGTEALAAMMASNYTKKDEARKVEEQLESANLYSQLGGLIGDTGAKFLEARHTQGFSRVRGGYKWAITAKGTEGEKGADIKVSDDIVLALADLNNAQHQYDDAFSQLTTLKEQLYMDWYKYMHLAYPFPDAIDNELLERMEYFLVTVAIPEVEATIKQCGAIHLTKNEQGGSDTITLEKEDDNDRKSLAYQVWDKWTQLSERLQTQKLPYNLSSTPAHYYWQPKAPVLLISGLTSDDKDDDLLKKAGNNNQKIYVGDWNFLPNNNALIANPSLPKDNTLNQSGQVTNPFILEWEVDLQDTALLRDEQGEIHPDALLHCVQIMENGPDFEKTDGFKEGETAVFSGSVIMNANARKSMVHKIIELIKAHPGDYFDLNDTPQKQQCDKFVATENMAEFLGILQDRVNKLSRISPQKDSPQYQVLCELQTLLTNHTIITQALSGFNHICSMRGMTPQLPIRDPMGFDNTRSMTQTIAKIVGDMDRYSPLMGFLFNPIRSGTIALNRLSLIDNFGVVTELNIPPYIAWAETMTDTDGKPFLRPRLTQPARLHFSFLDSDRNPTAKTDFKDLVRVHNLPESNPICGWLVPNYLDSNLMVFDKDGNALGYLDAFEKDGAERNSDKKTTWKNPPYKNNTPATIGDISNEHLRKIVEWLLGRPLLLDDFLNSVQNAQDNMAPSHATMYKSQSILMGQPIAVVRAAVHFQLKGLPVINQSWEALINDVFNKATYDNREKDNWNKVEIPFRLGEHQQLDDGLIGYWMENNGALEESFHHSGDYNKESLSINNTKIATLLLDPRAGVHCTSGIVPTVRTNIDPALFLPAMQRLEMWFKLAAVLQPNDTLEPGKNAMLNLPDIADKTWHWYDDFGGERNIAEDPTDGFNLSKNTMKSSFLTLKNKD